MTEIPLAKVLLGAKPFNHGNVNETFSGQVLTANGNIRHAIIKDLDIIQLCNELFAYSLASELKLPVPDCFLGLVPQGEIALSNAPFLPNGARLVFVSVDVKVPNVTFRLRADLSKQKDILSELAQWDELGVLYAFDTWIANIDRHPGNLLFGNSNEVWLIDHGHSFTGPNWQPTDLDATQQYRNRLSDWLTKELTSSQKKQHSKELRKFCSELSKIDVINAVRSSRVAELLQSELASALETFITDRSSNVDRLASQSLGVPVLI